MALWKDSKSAVKTEAPRETLSDFVVADVVSAVTEPSSTYAPYVPAVESRMVKEAKESIISSDLNIEGKIEGSGSVRIAGRFTGDVNVTGNLIVDAGATLTGSVRAKSVTIAGHLEGNVAGATRVELLATGVLIGDISAESLTVAAGSRMRGKAEFGWPETASRPS